MIDRQKILERLEELEKTAEMSAEDVLKKYGDGDTKLDAYAVKCGRMQGLTILLASAIRIEFEFEERDKVEQA